MKMRMYIFDRNPRLYNYMNHNYITKMIRDKKM